jgi:glycosyltransferase involved in cell wall biosynthesis
MRIAFFTPLSPAQTAIADHSEGLLPHLAREADIDLYIDDGYEPDDPGILSGFDVYSYREFPDRAQVYDLAVYAMGNNWDVHAYMHRLMQDYPGVIILHDTEFQHYFLGLTARQGDEAAYRTLMERMYGEPGRRAADLMLAGRTRQRALFPLVEPIVGWSRGVIVHNSFGEREVLSRCPWARVRQIKSHFHLPRGTREEPDVRALRAGLGVDDQFVLATYGLFIPDKRIDVCLEAFKRFRERRPDAHYVLIGDHSPYYDVPNMIRDSGLEESVMLTGWMEPAQFVEHMHIADIAIHLRYPHIGGTPYSPIRLLGLGRATVVSDIEPLDYFPEGCCVKIRPGPYEVETLLAVLTYLADHDGVRRQMGENGRQFIREHHDVRYIAKQYLDFFREVISAPSRAPSSRDSWDGQLVQETAAILAQWGVTEYDDRLLRPVAAVIADLSVLSS